MSRLHSCQIALGVITDQPFRVTRVEGVAIEPDSYAAVIFFADYLVGADIVSGELPELIKDVWGYQIANLAKRNDHCDETSLIKIGTGRIEDGGAVDNVWNVVRRDASPRLRVSM